MRNTKNVAIVALGAASLFAASPASAQTEEEVNPAAVAAAVRYGLPFAFDGYMTRCFETLSPDGFAVSNAQRLREKFSDGSDAAWPGARLLMMQFAEEETNEFSGLVGTLDDETLRPFVDGVIEAMAVEEIEPESCEVIERTLEILDPLPADNLAAVVGLLFEFGISDGSRAASDVTSEPEMSESGQRKLREQEQGL